MSTKQSRKQRKTQNAIRSIVRQEIEKEQKRPKKYTISLANLLDTSMYCHVSRLLPEPAKMNEPQV